MEGVAGGFGERGIFERQTRWRGLRFWEEWIDFVNFFEVGKPSLTDFNQVWLSLTEFTDFRVCYPISHYISELTRKIGRFYESTREFDNHGYGPF